MDLNIASNQTGDYTVNIPVFEGPLDLLLKLIEHSELEITAVSLSLVTDQYLRHIRAIDDTRPEQISAFLVIAACIAVKAADLILWRIRLEKRRHSREFRRRIADQFPHNLTPIVRHVRDDLRRDA